MKTSKYLYGVLPDVWWNLPYSEALNKRVDCGEILLSDLMKIDYMSRDDVRTEKVKTAVEFNKRLLKEGE